MSERFVFAIILSVALVVALAAGLLDWLTGQAGGRVLTGVIAGATVAYTGLTWRLVVSAAEERTARVEAERAGRRRRLRAALAELEANAARLGKTHEWYAHVPFSRSALDDSRTEWPSLPDEVREALQLVERDIARYNALVDYHRERVNLGSGAGDQPLEELAEEVTAGCERAVSRLYDADLTRP